MGNVKISLVCVSVILFLFAHSLFGQSKSHNHKLKTFPKENKSGCPLSYVSRFDREKPSDLAGLIVYGFREIFGSNFLQIPHYDCVPIVKELNLSETTIYISCQSGENKCSGKSPKIDVSAMAIDAENDVLTYTYTVSGGKIIGQGAKVIWDLSKAQAGIYTIRIHADDGCGDCGKAMTKEVRVVKCSDCK